ncbi:DUF533 domain-containing protein [Ruegeria sp. 2205SS24-7]|uniref:DUF533 domain-containing protein n=1 Tax=Ruegeria discodermiae TaxID=3064389 RepID=UPI002741A7F4|nr:DUF533 domain-containing protein [Ruegeria sp. 2205SS24-7]MDP5217949.1 DUF533 domain-containing protein [Ruegeria sp. 2205SS24-7]
MSFMKTLASVAVGFAAAKGMEKYQQMGGMAGLQNMFSGAQGQMGSDQISAMAEKFGLGGATEQIQNMLNQFTGAGAQGAAMAGLGGLMSSMQGAALSGGKQSADMMSAMFRGTPAETAMEEQAKLMLRAMIQAAKADGEIDDAERQVILDALGDDISDEERAFVQEQLAAPLDIVGLAQAAQGAAATQVYATSLAVMRIDTGAEAQYLNMLAQSLGLSDAARRQIHAQMGVPLDG